MSAPRRRCVKNTKVSELGRLAVTIQTPQFWEQWRALFTKSYRMPSDDVDDVEGVMALVGEKLAALLEEVETLPDPGREEMRELEQQCAFSGSVMAAKNVSGFGVLGAFEEFRSLCQRELSSPGGGPFFAWISSIAVHSYGQALSRMAMEKVSEEVAEGTPLILLTSDLPALFLVGFSSKVALDTFFSRLVLQCVRVGARSCIVDMRGVSERGKNHAFAALQAFLEHSWIRDNAQVVCVVQEGHESPAGALTELRFDTAFRAALEFSAKRIV